MTDELPEWPVATPEPRRYKCDGRHGVLNVKYVECLELLICADPQCARIEAQCEHSNNKWNDEETTLTCQFCGRDVT